MGNSNKKYNNDFFTTLNNKQIEHINSNFKILEVDYFNEDYVHSAI